MQDTIEDIINILRYIIYRNKNDIYEKFFKIKNMIIL